jgi:hypothetical protein
MIKDQILVLYIQIETRGNDDKCPKSIVLRIEPSALGSAIGNVLYCEATAVQILLLNVRSHNHGPSLPNCMNFGLVSLTAVNEKKISTKKDACKYCRR